MPVPPSCACGTCRICLKRAAVARYRKRHPDRVKAARAKWATEKPGADAAARRLKRLADPETVRQAARTYEEAHREEHYARVRRWKAKNTKKVRAHDAVKYALRVGKLVRQPCEVCGSTYRVAAHHDDYSKRLEVRWLCPTHHKQHHRLMNPAI